MTAWSALQLINLQVPTLFVCDPDGRLRTINEPGYAESERKPAPRFYMGRTAQGNVWRYRHDLPGTLVAEIEPLCRAEPVAEDLSAQPSHAAAIRAALDRAAPVTNEYRGPAYMIPESVQPPANVVRISAASAHLLEPHFPWALEARFSYGIGPLTAVVEQGSVVSLCFCSRLTPWSAEAGVETAAAFRRQGYASAVVSGWASAVRQLGRTALYSTSWDNLASQRVARKLNMQLYGEDWSIS